MPLNTDLSVPNLPQSWDLDEWDSVAPGVYPGTLSKARHLVRYHRKSLMAVGVLTRPGGKLVITGGPYNAWLPGHAHRVPDFNMPLNDEAHRDNPGEAA